MLRRDALVYAYEDGTPVAPKALSGTWDRWSGNRGVRFHDLRHAHATHLLASGIHPKVAQERLGHSSITITMDTYSHVLPGMGADAAKKVGDAFKAAMPKS
jgi:integrase